MLNKTTWMFLFAAAIVTQTASSQTTAAEPQSAPQSSPASSNTGLSDSAKADSTKSTPGEIAQSTLPHPFIKSVGGVGITPGQSDAAEQMAGICNKRASLSERQATLAGEASNQKLALRDLYSDFKIRAALNDWLTKLGQNLNKYEEETNDALDKLDPFETALKAAKLPVPHGPGEVAPEVPVLELDNYETIARGMAAWTGDFMKLAMNHEINLLDEGTTAKLQDLQKLQRTFADTIDNLRLVNKALTSTPPCDTTKLVKKEPSTDTPKEEPPASGPTPTPAPATAARSHAGAWIVGGVLVGGALIGGVVAAEELSKQNTSSNSGQVSGQCTCVSCATLCQPCTCTPNSGDCTNNPTCGPESAGCYYPPPAPFCGSSKVDFPNLRDGPL